MTKKHTFTSDTFEQVAEFGSNTTKKTLKDLKETFNPLNLLKTINVSSERKNSDIEKMKGKNSTPLDFLKLEKKLNDKEKVKTQALRNRLFQMVKGQEEKLHYEQTRKKQEKINQEAMIAQKQKEREKQEQITQAQSGIPQGKSRKNIFSRKKVASREQMEVKPSSGKQ